MSRLADFVRGCSIILSVDSTAALDATHEQVFVSLDLGLLTETQISQILALGFERNDDSGFAFLT